MRVENRRITVCHSCELWWCAVQMAQAKGQFRDVCQGTQALPAGNVQAESQSSSAVLQGMHQGRSLALDVQGPGPCLGLACRSRLREAHQGGPGPRTARREGWQQSPALHTGAGTCVVSVCGPGGEALIGSRSLWRAAEKCRAFHDLSPVLQAG